MRPADFALTPSLAARWQVLRDIWVRHLGAAFALETERRTWFNWLPVAFGLGIAAYFAADREPLWWGPAAALMLFGTVAFAIGRPVARTVLIALCAAMAGMAAATGGDGSAEMRGGSEGGAMRSGDSIYY